MHDLLAELTRGGPALLDGGWATELQAHGLPLGTRPDAWNLTHPDRVFAVAAAYAAAGSRVILTNTFGANRVALGHEARADEVQRINSEGVRISRAAAGPGIHVFGSMGPAGAERKETRRAAYMEQAAALAEAGADGLVIETMRDLPEAALATEAAARAALPVVACMTFGWGGCCSPAEAAQALHAAGAGAIGANCVDCDTALSVCRRLRDATRLPIWMNPNAGAPEIVHDRAVYSLTEREFAASGIRLFDAGANFVGGCCGVTPEHICCLGRAMGDAFRPEARE